MKKNLLFLSFLCALFTSTAVYAQPCDITNARVVSVAGNCTATVTFDMDRNNGNKYIYLHIWDAASFASVNKDRFQKGSGPVKADINGASNQYAARATVAIDNNDYNNPKPSSLGYRPDPSVVTASGYTVTVSSAPVSGAGNNALYRYTVSNVPLGSNPTGGCTASNFGVIVWSTQANSTNSHISCSAVGPAAAPANVVLSGTARCATASYVLSLKNNSASGVTATAITVYADNGGSGNDGMFMPGMGATDDKSFNTFSNVIIAPNGTANLQGTIPSTYFGYNLWAQVTFSDNSTKLQYLITSACSTLPVGLLNFSASRSGGAVMINWQTASEQTVRGYEIERFTDGSDWETVGTVTTTTGQANRGNSYRFSDANSFRGISQYRLKEISLDGRFSYSDVRTVRGDGVTGKLTVYPNPSRNGRTTVNFDNTTSRNVTISDMSGRVVKQYRNITAAYLVVDNLQNGFYHVQVTDPGTGESQVEKLVVKQ